MKLQSFADSEIGNAREINEDRFVRDDDLGLYIVCDGMGGHARGDLAAEIATSAVLEYVRHQHIQRDTTDEQLIATLRQVAVRAIAHANLAVCKLAKVDPTCRRMGSTVTMMIVVRNLAVIAHCGDSPVFRTTTKLERLTRDHTLAAELKSQGVVVHGHNLPSRFHHMLTRCLGRDDLEGPEVATIRLRAGDQFVLCSDGLAASLERMSPGELNRALDGAQPAAALVQVALRSDGRDNITALVINVEPQSRRSIRRDQTHRQTDPNVGHFPPANNGAVFREAVA